jgi:ABC-type lipoprotein release transport system permease subunit
MSQLPLGSLFKIILERRSSKRFLLGTIGSFSFSIAVILSTIGLMDGFEFTLKKALSNSNGDIKFVGRNGFFKDDEELAEKLNQDFIENYTSILQIEAFALAEEESKGVLLKGVKPEEFSKVTGTNLSSLRDGVVIGSKFQKKYNLKVGDSIALAFASGKAKNQGSAILENFRVDGVVTHGIYEKDFRFLYMRKDNLEKILAYKKGISNLGFIKIKNLENLETSIKNLKTDYYDDFTFDPYWSEFEVLLDAVKIEKFSISIILQLIVVVAIINVVAFIIFISEIKSQDFFMLRALGLSLKSFQLFWFYLLLFIWLISCGLAIGLVQIFNSFILTLPFLKIPGDIYVLSELDVILDSFDYLYVFGISLGWTLLIGFFTMRRMKKKSLVEGLRQEFS